MADSSRDYLIAGEDIAVDSLAPVEPGDVGTELRAARQARRIDISKVATDLKIREDFLLAIENARYGDLPGIPYAIGYVRTYSTYLGLDSEDLVTRFKEETQGLSVEPDLAFLMPVKEGRLGGPALIGLSLVLAGLAYGGWYYYSRSADDTATVAAPAKTAAEPKVAAVAPPTAQEPDTSPPPERAPASEAKPPEQLAPAAPSPETKPAVTKPATADTRGRLDATVVAAAGAVVRDPAPPAPPKPIVVLTGNVAASMEPTLPEPAAVRTAATPVRPEAKLTPKSAPASAPAARPKILLRATGLTWVRIQDPSGKVVLSRILRRGTRLEVPSQAGLTLHVGRANRLEVMVGEKVVPAMHAESLPVYNVSLDPETLLKRQ